MYHTLEGGHRGTVQRSDSRAPTVVQLPGSMVASSSLSCLRKSQKSGAHPSRYARTSEPPTCQSLRSRGRRRGELPYQNQHSLRKHAQSPWRAIFVARSTLSIAVLRVHRSLPADLELQATSKVDWRGSPHTCRKRVQRGESTNLLQSEYTADIFRWLKSISRLGSSAGGSASPGRNSSSADGDGNAIRLHRIESCTSCAV